MSGGRVSRLARAWRLPDDAAVVLLPGRLTSWKGQGVLIEAIARVTRRDVCCVLVGSDQGRRRYAARLIRQAEALGIADRLRVVGECDDMPAALMLADVVVHASTQPEAFGRVVIEAQAMGRPVIASDLGAPVEMVEQGVTGWRVKAGCDALAAAIEKACAAFRHGLNSRAGAGGVLRGYTVVDAGVDPVGITSIGPGGRRGRIDRTLRSHSRLAQACAGAPDSLPAQRRAEHHARHHPARNRAPFDGPVTGMTVAAAIGRPRPRHGWTALVDLIPRSIGTRIAFVTRRDPDALELICHDAAHVPRRRCPAPR